MGFLTLDILIRIKTEPKVRQGLVLADLNENLETLHLAPALFYYFPGFYPTTGFLNPPPLFLTKSNICIFRIVPRQCP